MYTADESKRRHYGPMAQEWFAAFGHDGIGTIGCDTMLASADVDGVMCIAIQALEKRTATNQEEVAALREQLQQKNQEIAKLQVQLSALQRESDRRYANLECLVRDLQQAQTKQNQHQAQLLGTEAGQ
jgi:septal ring factor EnvC (AmiA/AmiB activator)